METVILKEASKLKNAVVSTGGGMVVNEVNRTLMSKAGKRVYLQLPWENLVQRLSHDGKRPMLHNKQSSKIDRVRELLVAREPYYKEAELIITTTGQSASQTVTRILQRI